MSLPVINVPTYELVQPSTKDKLKYRPFLVKEEKLLLMAMEEDNEKQMVNAVRQIVNNCTFTEMDVNSLPMFDLEYIFLNIRAKSVGEVAPVKLLCKDDGKTYADVDIPLDEVRVHFEEGHTNIIELTDDIKVTLFYPQFELMSLMMGEEDTTGIQNAFKLIASCMGQIYYGEDMYECQDQTLEEIMEFLESLTQKQFMKLQEFFDTMPKLKHDIVLIHPKTKKKKTITLEGLNSFF